MILVFAALILLKSDELARFSASLLRNMTGQDPSLASAIDLRWFGYSYLAFRLVGALREYHIGKRSDANLAEFLAYTLFFPAISAGPIDRLPRFLGDLRKSGESISMRNPARQIELQDGFTRLFWGIFKKFALADTLAIFALSAQSAAQLQSTPWSWVLLYAYALRIYYDFSGYTDIAIGLGLFLGIRLPDNFAAPYLQANLTSFWNAWHITLAQWFRAYYFNPLTRSLRSRQLPIPLIILFSQLTTMLLIGLWHGLTWNFAIWGIWHGTGLFVHNRWADWLKTRLEGATPRPATQKLIHLSGWILTFQFVTLSWVWFALPDPIMAMRMLARLFGLTI
jgi:D-alanyl-lipoteichoic acid acyltransferase DltB (MBOAT superfamily)